MRISSTATSTVSVIAPAADSYTKRNVRNLLIKNIGSVTVYLQWTQESDQLTTANGFPLAPNEIISLNRDETASNVYAVTASGSSELRISGD